MALLHAAIFVGNGTGTEQDFSGINVAVVTALLVLSFGYAKTRAADAAGTRYRRYVNVRVIQGRQLIVYDTRAGVGGSELVRISRRIGKMPE